MLSVRLFFPLPDTEMIVLQLTRTHPLTPRLLIHRVQKAIPRRQRAVGPLFHANTSQKVLALRQLFTLPLDHFRRGCERGSHSGCREFQAREACRFERVLFCGGQVSTVESDELADGVRNLTL